MEQESVVCEECHFFQLEILENFCSELGSEVWQR